MTTKKCNLIKSCQCFVFCSKYGQYSSAYLRVFRCRN